MTHCTKFLVVGLFLLIHICTQCEGFLPGTAFESLFQPWLSAALRMEMEEKTESHELPEVKRLTTASYKGVNYVMVENVSLGFAQAERYCQNEFTDPMQLASVQSEDEWHMLTTVFGTSYPSEMWLGGTVRRSHSNTFVLHWLDSVPFTYHRFQPTERHRWMSNWRVTSHGCIVANSQSNALGNWSAELTPCTEPRPFVCKEAVKQSSSVMQFSPNSLQYDWRNLWNSMQYPSTVHTFRRQNHGLRKPGHFRFQTIPETKPGSIVPAQKNVDSPTTTEAPRIVESQTTPMVTSSTEVPILTSASPSRVAPRSAAETAATAIEPNPNNTSSTASPQTTSQAPILDSQGKVNDAEMKRVPKFTFFRTAPRALAESTDRTDVHLPQSNPATVMPSSSGSSAQVIPPPSPRPSSVWQMTSYVDEST